MKALRPLVALPCMLVACCVPPAPEPTPSPPVQRAPAQTPAPPPPSAPPANWMDAAQTPGDWSWRQTSGGSQALFGAPGMAPVLVLQCSRAQSQVLVVRSGGATAPVPMRILTESQTKTVSASPDNGGKSSLVAAISARDPILDAMAISKGRFAVETGGQSTIYVPSWPEVTRVIEDCR